MGRKRDVICSSFDFWPRIIHPLTPSIPHLYISHNIQSCFYSVYLTKTSRSCHYTLNPQGSSSALTDPCGRVLHTKYSNACAHMLTHTVAQMGCVDVHIQYAHPFQDSSHSTLLLCSTLHLAHICELLLRDPVFDRNSRSAESKTQLRK